MLDVERMSGPFGAVVRGIDVKGPSDEGFRQIGTLLFEQRIVAIPGQSLSNAEYVAFGRR